MNETKFNRLIISMKEIHFYSNKIKSLILMILSGIFTIGLWRIDFGKENLLLAVVLYLALGLFAFGFVYAALLLFRTKPLLTVTDRQVIIYNVLRKPTTIGFDNVLLFCTSDIRHFWIKTAEFIHIVLKQPKKNHNILDHISSKLVQNSGSLEYSIQTDMLNVKVKVLLELLQSKIRPYSLLEKEN